MKILAAVVMFMVICSCAYSGECFKDPGSTATWTSGTVVVVS